MLWKKIITFLILMALVLPMAAGAQGLIEKRPEFRQCQLKHDLTDLFGVGYEENALVSTGELYTLNLEGLPDNTILLDGTQMKNKAQVNIIPLVGPSYGFIFDQMENMGNLGNTDLWDGNAQSSDGMTKGEYLRVLAGKESLVIAVKAVPAIGDTAASLVDGLFTWIIDNARAGTKTKVSAEYATLACMIDKIETVADWIFIFLIVIAGIFVIWGAFEFLTGAGAPEKITGARNRIVWAIVAVAIAFLAKGIVRIIVQLMV